MDASGPMLPGFRAYERLHQPNTSCSRRSKGVDYDLLHSNPPIAYCHLAVKDSLWIILVTTGGWRNTRHPSFIIVFLFTLLSKIFQLR